MSYNLTLIECKDSKIVEKNVDTIYIFAHIMYRLRRWCKVNWGQEGTDWNIFRNTDAFGFHATNLQTRDVVEVR